MRQSLLSEGFSKLAGLMFDEEHKQEPYSNHRSSKVDGVIALVEYHLGHRVRTPLHSSANSANVLRPCPPSRFTRHSDPDSFQTPDKILIYLSFPSLNWFIRGVSSMLFVAYDY